MTVGMFGLLLGGLCFITFQVIIRGIPWLARKMACHKHGHNWKVELDWNGNVHQVRCSFCGKIDYKVPIPDHMIKPSLPIIRRPMKIKAEVEFLDEGIGK